MKVTVLPKKTTVQLHTLSEGSVFVFEECVRDVPSYLNLNLVTDEGTYVNLNSGCQFDIQETGVGDDFVKKYCIANIELQEI